MTKRILILSDSNSAHTQKWSIALAQKGYSIGIFTLSFPADKWYESFENISVFCPVHFKAEDFRSSLIRKIKYLKTVSHLKKVIRDFAPDIVHAHYATSYGLIGALAGFHPYFISAWGSDLMDFPYKNILNLKMIKFIFRKSDKIFATSKALASHAEKFTSKKIEIIPFGVDTEKFKPGKKKSLFPRDNIVIGSVKSLEKIYGIDILINAFANLHSRVPQLNLKLLLVGSGSKEGEYKKLVKNLSLNDLTIFTGRISHSELEKYYNMINIFVNVSYNESFGVSVLEASACELPVIVSRVGGLGEVIEENKTGLFVEVGSIDSLSETLNRLIENPELRNNMGSAGRRFVVEKYEWKKSVHKMTAFYETY